MMEVSAIPRIGDKLDTGSKGTFEVIEVVHTPIIRQWDAVVVLKSK